MKCPFCGEDTTKVIDSRPSDDNTAIRRRRMCSILKTWNAKGLRTVHDVRSPVAAAGASRNIRVDRAAPSGNDILKNATRRRSLIKKPE